MRINHIALYALDLEKIKSFYEKYFGAESGAGYYNPKTGLKTCFLTLGDGSRLEIMNRPGLEPDKKGMVTGYVHLALEATSAAEVDSITNRLNRDGYTVVSGPRVTGDGYYESCILDPEGNEIEIVGPHN